jgi:magnesium transporter
MRNIASTPPPHRTRGRVAAFFRWFVRVTKRTLIKPATALPKVQRRPPGIEIHDHELPLGTEEGPLRVTCIDYSPEQCQFQEVPDLANFLTHHRPTWSRVRWINVDGLTRLDAIRALAEKYQLHPLAIEDVLHTVQRPKSEDYPAVGDHPGRLFIIARSLELKDSRLLSDQTSFFLGRNTLLTFQETAGDWFDPIRARIRTQGSRVREHDVSFLLYLLMDAIVDGYFPILERTSERLEEVEEEILNEPTRDSMQKIHAIKRDLVLIRRAAWPMRELIAVLQREKHECLSETTQTYFRDVYDHCVQIIDLIETYREIAGALTETYMSSVSNRMNEIMKVLTIIGTIFIPLTFLVGVYGMNMPIPENKWWGSYPLFWTVSAIIAGSMLAWFRRRGWI